MNAWLHKCLAEPRLAGVDVDSGHLVEVHRSILTGKPMIREVFLEIYRACLDADRRLLRGQGLQVEIGAGSSFFKEVCPSLISTDIKAAAHLDMVVDAQAMPFGDRAVRTVFGIHCFHHLPRPDQFFAELERVLVPGGGCVLVEPFHGPVARVFFRRLFETETFDTRQPSWHTESTGPMRGANQALSYIVFVRDALEFARRYPGLEIVERRPLTNYPRYLLSGGLNFRALVPAWTGPAIKMVETLGSPLAHVLALHHMIVLRRR